MLESADSDSELASLDAAVVVEEGGGGVVVLVVDVVVVVVVLVVVVELAEGALAAVGTMAGLLLATGFTWAETGTAAGPGRPCSVRNEEKAMMKWIKLGENNYVEKNLINFQLKSKVMCNAHSLVAD